MPVAIVDPALAVPVVVPRARAGGEPHLMVAALAVQHVLRAVLELERDEAVLRRNVEPVVVHLVDPAGDARETRPCSLVVLLLGHGSRPRSASSGFAARSSSIDASFASKRLQSSCASIAAQIASISS